MIKYYVHMQPRSADKVSILWKCLHITLFAAIVASASVATWSIYKILEMYSFHCILYAKVEFEESYEERLRNNNTEEETNTTTAAPGNENSKETVDVTSAVNCSAVPDDPRCQNSHRRKLSEINWRAFRAYRRSNVKKINNTGFINLRKTALATIYMCDLMFFSPITSIIMGVILAALTLVGGKGGAGNPGDLFPNPWICVYPFLALCVFMVIFSFIAQNLFESGLNVFCSKYESLTKESSCTEKMDRYTRQFSVHHEEQPFYYNFFVGSIASEVTSALWVVQALIYVFRILCLADFTTYMTRIKVTGNKKDRPDPKMANVVMKMVDPLKMKKV